MNTITEALSYGVSKAVGNGIGGKTEKRSNNSQGGWIVQKFGGTSVGKFAVNIAEDIVR